MGKVSLNRCRLLMSAAPILVLAAGLPSGAAYAQQAAASDRLEIVTVTAEKRSENVQKVPIAITAFSSAQLQDKAITDVHALGDLTPGVNLDAGTPFSGSTSVLAASIRGIGQDDFAMNLDPGVGVYVDGVYYARTVGANQNLMDVERVEILKGPQGTLFGRNTIGGAISVTTREPGDDFMFQGVATAGSFNRRDIGATADIPISDTLHSTITVSSLIRDGYQKRIPYPGTIGPVEPPSYFHEAGRGNNGNTQGGQNQQVVRGKLVWDASESLKATLTADWTHEDQSAMAQSVLQTQENNPASLAGLYNACVLGFIPAAAAICGPTGPAIAGNLTTGMANTGMPLGGIGRTPYTSAIVSTGNIDTTYATGNNFSRLDSYGAALTLDWTLNPNLSLKSISAYRHMDWSAGMDQDASPIVIVEPSFAEGQKQTSEELQLIGNAFEDKLNYVVGLYYFNENGFIHDYVPLTMLQIDGMNTLDTTSYAAFVHANYNVTDALSVTLGARYSVEQKEFEGFQHDMNSFAYKAAETFGGAPPGTFYPITTLAETLLGFPVANDPNRYFPAGVNKHDFYLFTPTAGVNYQFTDDLMGYFSWSKGYKSGGWTTRLSNPIPDASLAAFGPEKAQTYEVGMKSEWLDHRLLLNLAGYYTQYDGIQLNVQVGVSPTLKNAGNAEIKGVELEGKFLVGNGLTVNGAVSYIDARYTKTEIGTLTPTTALPLDTPLPKTPAWKFNISPEYSRSLDNGGTLTFIGDWIHTGKMSNDIFNTPLLRRAAVDVVNLSVHYLTPNGKYELIAGGSNIGDERYVTSGQDQTAGGMIFGNYNAPAEWYVSLRVKD